MADQRAYLSGSAPLPADRLHQHGQLSAKPRPVHLQALEAKLEQRFHNGLNILASYTFSKTLTDADVIQPYWSTLQNGGAVQDPENLRGEKAVSSEDVPNNFVVSYIYELPDRTGQALPRHFATAA